MPTTRIYRPLCLPFLAFVLLPAVVGAGCECDSTIANSHESHTVDVPISTQMKPYVMLLVDKSGSMLDPASCAPGDTCTRCTEVLSGAYDPDSANPCKWNDLKEALASKDSANPGFLTASQDLAEFGLAVSPAYESGATCQTGQILVGLTPGEDHVDEIIAQLETVSPGGGTPTAATLALLAQTPRLATAEAGRSRFVIILTDGAPNCSQSTTNQGRCNSCVATGTCTGTDRCNPTFGSDTNCDTQYGLGTACLDDTGLLEQITALHDNGVDTFIIWFGSASAQPLTVDVLNEAAVAGGRPREGAATKYYDASSRDELRQLLADISVSLQSCVFTLDPAPTDPDILEVVFVDKANGDTETILVRDTEWRLNDDGTVEILGDRCTQVQQAGTGTLDVVFRYVN